MDSACDKRKDNRRVDRHRTKCNLPSYHQRCVATGAVLPLLDRLTSSLSARYFCVPSRSSSAEATVRSVVCEADEVEAKDKFGTRSRVAVARGGKRGAPGMRKEGTRKA